ncbi:MAG: hypothetical protein ACXADC_16540 [Candidatus Thorarchaeota archaeon]
MANHATDMKTDDAHDLLICKIDGVEHVWLFAEDEWNLQGELITIPRRKSAITSIRGLQVKMPTSLEIEPPAGIEMPSNMKQRVKNELTEIAALRQHVFGVRFELGLDSGMYSISFESDGEIMDRRIVNRTSDLLKLLRRPLVDGTPLQSSRDLSVYMTWNPYEDIDYGELQLFQPYVERRTPYVHVRVPLPMTSQGLLEQPSVKEDVIISHVKSECPIVDGSAKEHGLCWQLKSETPGASDLVDRLLSDHDISSLLIGREVFLEGARLSLDLKFENDPESREGWVFRESRKIARVLELRPYPSGVFIHLDSEQLECTLLKDGRSVQITMHSNLTGERVSSGALIPPEGKWEVERVLEGFKDDTEAFIQTYFGKDERPENRIIDYADVLEKMRTILKKTSKERPRPRRK